MRMTNRGHEHFTDKPRAVTSKFGKDKELSVFDRQRLALMQMREEEAAQIRNQEDLNRELFDFSYATEVDEYGLPLFTPYQIPDTVPDVYVPETDASKVQEKVEENSVSKDGSEPEPSGGAE